MRALCSAAASTFEHSDLTIDLARLFSKVVLRVLRRAPKDCRSEALAVIVEVAPLSVSESVILHAVAEQGKWIVGAAKRKEPEHQLVEDSVAVDRAVQRWLEIVRNRVQQGSLIDEPLMHGILYRMGEFGLAFTEVFGAVSRICETEVGLKKFLSIFIQDSPFNDIDMFGLVEDAQAFIERIRRSESCADGYAWLTNLIASDETKRMINERAASRRNLGQTA